SASATAALSLPAPASLYRSRESDTGGMPETVITGSGAGEGAGGTSPTTVNDSAAARRLSVTASLREGDPCCIERLRLASDGLSPKSPVSPITAAWSPSESHP